PPAARSYAAACSARGSGRGRARPSETKHLTRVFQTLDEAVDLLAHRVDSEAGARRGGDVEPVHQHLGAVVAGADGDAVAGEDLRDVVGVDALDLEGDRAETAFAAGRAEDAQARHLGDPFEGVVGDLLLVLAH